MANPFRSKTATNVAFVVATLLMIAGAIFWAKDNFKEQNRPESKETVAPVILMSSDGVEDNIERRLSGREGRPIVAKCPKKVDQAIGTKFDCDVFFPNREDAIATAHVVVDGPNGEFSWKSEPKVKSDDDEEAT
ncbi:hypothetical protein J2X11_001526 [Aeromicrobium panaciterrae]|uniref:DUF4333 domain-containing protein n=1 Tax=Aeromicrobium panaciterrae TaxID=363861 RepID=A0ABU1UND6_9ACTN|nr:hypothetical protein [Aeromicrobium panaciterrae]MDR7086687.1 hypothetical protein [Aeromicrobium panaciterrae]